MRHFRILSRLVLPAILLFLIISLPVKTASEGPLAPSLDQGHFHRLRQGLSTNWSGYAALTSLSKPKRNSVSQVAGSWTVPTLSCGTATTYSSIWVGIDGYSDNSVEQIGTEHDCYLGKSYYSVWYEMYPHPMKITPVKIKAGDAIEASVSFLGHSRFRLTIQNQTSGSSFNTTQRINAKRTSAEWVVEAPSSFWGVLPLSNFGTVEIRSANATISGHQGSISDSLWKSEAITMVNTFGTPKAIPSALAPSGDSFSVEWHSN